MSNQIKNYNDVGNIVHYNSNNRIFHAFVEHPLFSNHLGLVLHQIIQYELSVALFLRFYIFKPEKYSLQTLQSICD